MHTEVHNTREYSWFIVSRKVYGLRRLWKHTHENLKNFKKLISLLFFLFWMKSKEIEKFRAETFGHT